MACTTLYTRCREKEKCAARILECKSALQIIVLQCIVLSKRTSLAILAIAGSGGNKNVLSESKPVHTVLTAHELRRWRTLCPLFYAEFKLAGESCTERATHETSWSKWRYLCLKTFHTIAQPRLVVKTIIQIIMRTRKLVILRHGLVIKFVQFHDLVLTTFADSYHVQILVRSSATDSFHEWGTCTRCYASNC
jgi:hypothetical protein